MRFSVGLATDRILATEVGRTAPLEICYSLEPLPDGNLDAGAVRERVAVLEAMGVGWLTVGFPATTRREYVERLARFARDVL